MRRDAGVLVHTTWGRRDRDTRNLGSGFGGVGTASRTSLTYTGGIGS